MKKKGVFFPKKERCPSNFLVVGCIRMLLYEENKDGIFPRSTFVDCYCWCKGKKGCRGIILSFTNCKGGWIVRMVNKQRRMPTSGDLQRKRDGENPKTTKLEECGLLSINFEPLVLWFFVLLMAK